MSKLIDTDHHRNQRSTEMTAIKLPAYSTLSKMSKAAIITLGDKIAVAMDADFVGDVTMTTRDLVFAVTQLHEEYTELLDDNAYDQELADEEFTEVTEYELSKLEAIRDAAAHAAAKADRAEAAQVDEAEASQMTNEELAAQAAHIATLAPIDALLAKLAERYIGGAGETSNQRKALRAALRKLGYRVSDHKSMAE